MSMLSEIRHFMSMATNLFLYDIVGKARGLWHAQRNEIWQELVQKCWKILYGCPLVTMRHRTGVRFPLLF